MFATTSHTPTYWGPARHDPEHPLHPTGAADWDPFDPRDDAFARPDDN